MTRTQWSALRLVFAALIVVVALSLTIYRVLDRALAGMLARRGF